jgi:hypothetical protein
VAILGPLLVTGSSLVMALAELWFVTALVGLPLTLSASISIPVADAPKATFFAASKGPDGSM